MAGGTLIEERQLPQLRQPGQSGEECLKRCLRVPALLVHVMVQENPPDAAVGGELQDPFPASVRGGIFNVWRQFHLQLLHVLQTEYRLDVPHRQQFSGAVQAEATKVRAGLCHQVEDVPAARQRFTVVGRFIVVVIAQLQAGEA